MGARRLIMDDVGDGKNPAGEWTGTYKNTGVIWRGDVAEEFHATQDYVDIVKPNPGAEDQVTALPGISAGARDLFGVVLDGNRAVSPPQAAQNVVEVLSGFVVSAHAGNVKTQLPLPRRSVEELAEAMAEETARL